MRSITSWFRSFRRATDYGKAPAVITASAGEFEGDALVDVPFANLSINQERLRNCGLTRPPTWEEIYAAISYVAESGTATPPRYGRCVIYAGLTRGIVELLTDTPSGIGAGGVAIGVRGRPDRFHYLPADIFTPCLETGGFHAWAGFEHAGETYFADLSYKWFHQNAGPASTFCGPWRFFVAEKETMHSNRLIYNTDDKISKLINNATDLELIQESLLHCIAYLRDFVMHSSDN